MFQDNFQFQKGASLYLAILLTSILLAIGLGLSFLSVFQIQTLRGLVDSVSAFFAADTGIEQELFERNAIGTPPYTGNFEGRTYQVKILAPDQEGCPSTAQHCVVSAGQYQGTRRAIRITR